jgi:Resolvase, N terminal domain
MTRLGDVIGDPPPEVEVLNDTPYMGHGGVRALVGARASSVQGDEKTSHITQRGKGEAYAESQDWTVVGAFEDLDVSAIKLSPWDRPDLKTWLTDRADEWTALIFAKTDRGPLFAGAVEPYPAC